MDSSSWFVSSVNDLFGFGIKGVELLGFQRTKREQKIDKKYNKYCRCDDKKCVPDKRFLHGNLHYSMGVAVFSIWGIMF